MLLVVEGPGLDCENQDDFPFRVEFPQNDIPLEVREKMAGLTLEHWQGAAAGGGQGWRLHETLLVSMSAYGTPLV